MSAMKRLAMAEGISFNSRAEDAAIDGPAYEPLHGERPAFVTRADGSPANPYPSVVPDFRSIPVPMTPERGAMLWESLRSLVHILAHVPLACLSQSERIAIDIASARLTAGLDRPAEPHSRYVPVHPETGAALV